MRTPSEHLPQVRGLQVPIHFTAFRDNGAEVITPTVGTMIKFSLRTKDLDVARFRRNTAEAELAKAFEAVKKGPQKLNHRQLLGLSRAIHDLYVQTFQQEPGSVDLWSAHKGLNRAILEGRISSAPRIVLDQMPDEREYAAALFGSGLTAGINALPAGEPSVEALERRFGLLCDWVLMQEGIAVDPPTRKRLLEYVARASETGSRRLQDNVRFDYGPDHRAARYPIFERTITRTFTQAFEQWQQEVGPAPGTVSTWKGVLKSLLDFLRHDEVHRLRRSDVVAWKDHLVEQGKAAKTINHGHVAALNTLLNYEVSNGRLTENVAAGVKVQRRIQAGEARRGYSTNEVMRILQAATAETHPNLRWLPWLAALSGARIGEVAQLWGQRIRDLGGIPVMEIRPAEDGGRLKNSHSERIVPLHPALIEAGFLAFVAERGLGPLFYVRSSGDPMKMHATKSVSNRVAAWIQRVRRAGDFLDDKIDPNHGFRHWFKSELAACGVADSLADFITGHAKRSVADRYRHYGPAALMDAIRRLPLPTGGAPVQAVVADTLPSNAVDGDGNGQGRLQAAVVAEDSGGMENRPEGS
jgi:integrase